MDKEVAVTARDFDNHVEAGFQLATFQGPLCSEPMEGIAYFVDSIEIDQTRHYPLNISCGLAAPDVRFLMSMRKLLNDGKRKAETSHTVREAETFDNRQQRADSEETSTFFHFFCHNSPSSAGYDAVYLAQNICCWIDGSTVVNPWHRGYSLDA